MLTMACAPLEFVMAVLPRGGGEKSARFFSERGALLTVMTLGRGTASRRLLDYLGLEEKFRDVLFCVMPRDAARAALEVLCGEMDLAEPGHGIAFTVPLGAAGRARAEGCGMEFGYDLVLAVVNQGYADEAMEAARQVGATGGTIVHARGVGMKQAEKFFGVSVQAEKEMLFTARKTPAGGDGRRRGKGRPRHRCGRGGVLAAGGRGDRAFGRCVKSARNPSG
jgi:hypothetical protein